MPNPARLGPPNVGVEGRLAAVETEVRKLRLIANAALILNPVQRPGNPGAPLAGGKPLWDSFGLIQTLQLAAQINGLSGNNGTNAFATIGSTTTLTVPTGRTQNFLALATLVASTAGGPGLDTTFYRINVGGQLSNVGQVVQQATAAAVATVTLFVAALNLAGGTYTIKVEGRTDGSAGTVAACSDGTVNVFLMGG